MNTVADRTEEQPVEDGPISEKTKALMLAQLARIEQKVDMITARHETWRAAFIRSIKQFLSLLDKP